MGTPNENPKNARAHTPPGRRGEKNRRASGEKTKETPVSKQKAIEVLIEMLRQNSDPANTFHEVLSGERCTAIRKALRSLKGRP
jgi:hypothetical protein